MPSHGSVTEQWTVYNCEFCGLIPGDETQLQVDLSLRHEYGSTGVIAPACDRGLVARVEVVPASTLTDTQEERDEAESSAQHWHSRAQEAREIVERWWSDAHMFSGQEDYARQLHARDKEVLRLLTTEREERG